MFSLGPNDEEYQIIEIEDHSIGIFRWQEWKFNLFIFFIVLCAVITIGGQAVIVYYIGRKAPKKRPINTMIIFDQVSVHTIAT